MVGLSLKPELKISIEAPQWTEPGMGGLQLDRNGKLIWYQHVVASRPLETSPAEPIDWEALLSEDRLPFAWSEMTTVKHEDADFPQQVQFDHLQTWEGVAKSGEKMRVIAATYRGSPTYFEAFSVESVAVAQTTLHTTHLILFVFASLFAIASIGFGIDAYHGVCHAHVLENIAALDRAGAYLGAFSVSRSSPEGAAFLDAVAKGQDATRDVRAS